MDKIEFIARSRHLAWCCYQMGCNQPYNLEPTKDQLESLMNGVKFGLQNPNATPEENHENWMKCKIEQGWVYGEVKDLEKKSHYDLVPFEQLLKVEKDKDIMDCEMNKHFAKLWDLSCRENKPNTPSQKSYTVEQIKAYAMNWAKPSLSSDALICGEIENERLLAFVHYLNKENDSDNIDKFLQKKNWQDFFERSKNV